MASGVLSLDPPVRGSALVLLAVVVVRVLVVGCLVVALVVSVVGRVVLVSVSVASASVVSVVSAVVVLVGGAACDHGDHPAVSGDQVSARPKTHFERAGPCEHGHDEQGEAREESPPDLQDHAAPPVVWIESPCGGSMVDQAAISPLR